MGETHHHTANNEQCPHQRIGHIGFDDCEETGSPNYRVVPDGKTLVVNQSALKSRIEIINPASIAGIKLPSQFSCTGWVIRVVFMTNCFIRQM